MQLRLIQVFGLRRQEAIMFKPYQSDFNHYISVRAGTKGGRQRCIPIDKDCQRATLNAAKAMVKRVNDHIGDPALDLKQALNRFSHVMSRFHITLNLLGVTAHGLRHERLNDLFEEISGIPSPVRASPLSQEDAKRIRDVDPARLELARAQVSAAAGHNRLNITSAYIGSTHLAMKSAMNWKVIEGQLVSDDTMRWKRLAELGVISARTPEEDKEFSMLKQQLKLTPCP
jgi:integrase